jgi:hypothetical protein
LRTELRPGSGQVAIAVLHGLGGIGKTSIAVEYAYRHLEEVRAAPPVLRGELAL